MRGPPYARSRSDLVRRGAAGVRRLHEHQWRGGERAAEGGIAIADLTTGLFAAQAILLALVNRHVTGQGQLVEVSLLDSMFADMEAVFTYESTDHVQALIVGREITGCQAFAPGRGR